MKITIVGCGKVGTSLLERLVVEGHDLLVIDNDPKVIAELTNIYDVMGICGNGVDWETLNEAGAQNSDLFVATTGSDEFNMLSCFIAE